MNELLELIITEMLFHEYGNWHVIRVSGLSLYMELMGIPCSYVCRLRPEKGLIQILYRSISYSASIKKGSALKLFA